MSAQFPPQMGISEDFMADCYAGTNSFTLEHIDPKHEYLEKPSSLPAEPRDSFEKPSTITYEQKEEFLENIFNGRNGYDTAVKEEHTASKEGNDLPPVYPYSAGEGHPYAPENFPNPGDKWVWKVGTRVNRFSFFQDRFVYLPKSLYKPNHPRQFASKPALERFLLSEFPDADVNAILAFSWKVPAQAAKELLPEVSTEDGNKETSEQKHRASHRKRKQPEFLTLADEQTTTGADKKKTTTGSDKKKTTAGSAKKKTTAGSAKSTQKASAGTPTPKRQSQQRYKHSVSSVPGKAEAEAELPLIDDEAAIEEFDNYLNSLDDILAQPVSKHQQIHTVAAKSSVSEDELAEARMKLSWLLNMDFPSLICSQDLGKLTSLASKVRMDPTLNAEQLVMLKLVEEIPSFSEVFLENKGIIDHADKFLASLEVNKAKVASLRKEYSELKDRSMQLQTEVDWNTSAVQGIDDQIAQLRARRDELTKAIETKKNDKVELTNNQKLVANSLPKVVTEVQAAKSKIPEWELKKENALKRQEEIIARFAPLKGLTF